MKEGNIIFVGGIHGVGKTKMSTTLCQFMPLTHVTASSLIGTYKNKLVKDVALNQDILINAIESELSENNRYLMDGHFCLLTQSKKIERICIDVFRKMRLMGILAIHADIEIIQQRLQERDSEEYSMNLLDDFQNVEMEHAKHVADTLSLPLHIVSGNCSDDLSGHVDFIKGVFS